ncbi:MAG: FtsW/RodA/SpoVE family cell cycle protein [Coriobacteriia bacterium]|nr:FtsW/RodA/SpoVE family cell cycle protein [Coriobacteriia bacterium]
MNRRTTELLLLIAACPVVILLFSLAILNDGKPVNFLTLAVPLGLFAAFIISHFAIRKLAPNADPALLPIAFTLSGIGIAFVMRLAPNLATRQIMWLFVGIAAMLLVLFLIRSTRKLGNYKYTIMIIGIILLLLPAIIGTEHNGSKIWLTFAGFSFQPGEIAKVLIVLFLAGYLAENREMLSVSGRHIGPFRIPDLRTLVPLIIMWVISLLIVIFQRDLGSALLFFGIFVIMLYVATGRLSYVVAAALFGIVGAIAAFLIFPHVQTRVEIWLDPLAYMHTSGYQLVQALFSLADGSIIGTGIGRGLPTLIPIVESDFIFVAIAEEMGLIGACGVIILFILFAVRGLSIASRARTDMEAFTATGLTAAISFQAFVIIGGVTALIPLTGVTLPFMSQGGSSLLASFIILGLLLRTSDNGTGHEAELQSTSVIDGGVLGRVALGKRLTLLVTCLCLLFALEVGNLTYTMVIRAPELHAMPSNGHQLVKEERAQRGSILTSDGVILAESVARGDGGYERIYPQGSLAAHVIGYASPRFGLAGVEASQQEVLRGEIGFANWIDAINSMAGIPTPGNDVTLTIDSRIQATAERLLAGHYGAVVVLDAKTGEVLAMASAPTYDVNTVETLILGSGDDGTGPGGGGSELYNRATMALYAPGSTFKIVTLTAALKYAGIQLSDLYDAPGSMDIGNAPVTNFGGVSYGEVTVQKAFELSMNTVFGQMAYRIGPATLVATAEEFGFGRRVGRDFFVSTSLMPNPAHMTDWETAWAGAGEPVGEHAGSPPGPQVTVVQMAMVGAAFANNGVIMNPYLIASTNNVQGQILSRTTPSVFTTVGSASLVSAMNTALKGVVSQGTGYEARINGYTVYGKTGTAEKNSEGIDSWFVGYVDVGGRSVVVAMVLEDARSGEAVPLARQILQTAIEIYE